MLELGKFFENDAKSRGIHIYPTTFQLIDEHGNVVETHYMDDYETRLVIPGDM